MAREFRLLQVDVFTERVLTGNPLAVVLDAGGLDGAEMQAIARETNLPETTFVLPPTRADCAARVRIFTPGRELPFAGHPTLGTAWVLAREGRLPPGTRQFRLEEGIGPVPVELEGDPAAPTSVWMAQLDPSFDPDVADRGGMARALGLDEAELRPGLPLQPVSTGNRFLVVPLRDRATVDRAGPPPAAAFAPGTDLAGVIGVLVFAADGPGRAYARMFAPQAGIPEDPATGSAAGPLAAYLARHRLIADGDDLRILIEQGTRMGRQGFLHVRLRARDGAARDIRVGGGVVPVLEARLRLP